MSPANGTGPACDQALLETIAETGLVYLVQEADAAALLQAQDFPALSVPDVAVLTAPVLAGISEITVLQPPTFTGALFGHRVQRQLEAVGWKGRLMLVPLPDEAPSLGELARQYPDRLAFGTVVLSLA